MSRSHQTTEEMMDNFARFVRTGINKAQLGWIVKYDAATNQAEVDVVTTPVFIDPITDEEQTFQMPRLLDVPVLMPGGGNTSIYFGYSSEAISAPSRPGPLAVGAECRWCLVIFLDFDINWFKTGSLDTRNRGLGGVHALNNAVVIPVNPDRVGPSGGVTISNTTAGDSLAKVASLQSAISTIYADFASLSSALLGLSLTWTAGTAPTVEGTTYLKGK